MPHVTEIIHTGKSPSCINCGSFHQHYVYYYGAYHISHIGHCSYPRCKDRYITDSCPHFRQTEEKL